VSELSPFGTADAVFSIEEISDFLQHLALGVCSVFAVWLFTAPCYSQGRGVQLTSYNLGSDNSPPPALDLHLLPIPVLIRRDWAWFVLPVIHAARDNYLTTIRFICAFLT
jgi:hypothetical protein